MGQATGTKKTEAKPTKTATVKKTATKTSSTKKKTLSADALKVSQQVSQEEQGTTGITEEQKQEIANTAIPKNEKPLSVEATNFVTNGEPVRTENAPLFKRGPGRPKSTVHKTKVTMELSTELLARIDKIINKSGLPRTSYVTIALEQKVLADEKTYLGSQILYLK